MEFRKGGAVLTYCSGGTYSVEIEALKESGTVPDAVKQSILAMKTFGDRFVIEGVPKSHVVLVSRNDKTIEFSMFRDPAPVEGVACHGKIMTEQQIDIMRVLFDVVNPVSADDIRLVPITRRAFKQLLDSHEALREEQR